MSPARLASRRGVLAGIKTGSAYPAAVMALPGLRSYWRLDETSGVVLDDVTNLHDGAASAAAALNKAPLLVNDSGRSADCNGQYMTFPFDAADVNGGSWALNFMANWVSGTSLFRDWTASTGSGTFIFSSGGTLQYRVQGQTYNTGIAIGTVQNAVKHWSFVRRSLPVTEIWVNGVKIFSGGGSGLPDCLSPFVLGANGSLTTQFTVAKYDEVSFVTGAPTNAQLLDLGNKAFGL